MLSKWKKLFLFLLASTFMWLLGTSFLPSTINLAAINRNYAADRSYITVFPHRHLRNTSHKLILLWTKYFGSDNWNFRHDFLQSCSSSTCKVTSDRSSLAESDAVLFNSRDLDASTVFPKTRTPEQVWALHNSEPPYYIYTDLALFNGVFNWTSWFRQDADIYSPYGDYKEVDKDKKINLPNFHAQKSNLSLWVASSCTDRARRYRLINEIQKYMKIDTYGACGRNICPKNSPKCHHIFRKYKFLFALENGHCRGYVTEKFWNAFRQDQIPVVWGGADYDKIAPPGSYINMKHFSSPRAVAMYLQHVANNASLYNSYFRWRRRYELTPHQVVGWCHLCTALHDRQRPAQLYTDLRGWVDADTCHGYSVWGMMTDYIARFAFLIGF
ncbi:alpha-(1,3)-fucosyltransferase C-like [Haliotis rubra]|uniref:alpha-(1,3)-fucosyltransferase C-like n=1 Tax=Haliotis rubra TaxID=36100 RepID=UPI001EE563CB|nr:alpha-(1,3)-fucosyltransferase C-like [Haliotis rubra]XP_046578443.1 alpha-(1,3)-fucosyltransferase C-like [Haliotis rubra]XP_046578451.1 alpha-(1,3)-fucosyltransferase C-like [Haliotis rubra]